MDLERNRARMRFDEEQVRTSLHLLRQGSAAVELRVLKPKGDMLGGRFNTRNGVIDALEQHADSKAAYVVLNALPADCPVENSLSKYHPMAHDEDISRRQWLLVDVDAKRASGTNSTEIEHWAALKLGREMRASLSDSGWPAPVMVDSGNGSHLLYRIDLPNDGESKALVNGVLAGLDAQFSTASVKVDRTVGNASRISKLPGTLAAKDVHTVARPQRLSVILSVPDRVEVVSVEQLRERAIVRAVERPPMPYSAPLAAKGFTMQHFIDKHGIRTRSPQAFNGDGHRWQMDCPFDPRHKAPDAALFEYADGAKAFKCSHDSCSHQNWQSFRAHIEGPRIERAPVIAVDRGLSY